ncbi:MAG: hypothetical protein LBC39_08595 [Methanobrevibacter sp.]|jgi:uncharacterized UPF0146 family protein|nr:hypothetical protein [Candidatus Methanovirga aequatorialis]
MWWEDLGEYIQGYLENNQIRGKVVEMAIGNFFKVLDYLDGNGVEVVGVDLDPKREDVVKEDVTDPKLDLYEGVEIVYSIRPPYELQPYIEEIAKNLNALLIVKPLFNEDLNMKSSMNLKNYKKAIFYQHQY